MTGNNVIPFDSGKRTLKKAEKYVEDIDAFLADREKAIGILIGAMKIAEDPLKKKIILMLGGFAREKIAVPLYEIMADPKESDDTRHTAAIQLSITAAFLENNGLIVRKLLDDIESDDPLLRANAAYALGWEKNTAAAAAIGPLLDDINPQVQQAAVDALSNIGEGPVMQMLIDRMENAPVEQQRCILYNLWRFEDRKNEVIRIYRKTIESADENLRVDALELLTACMPVEDHISTYLACLEDSSARMRTAALEQLGTLNKEKLAAIRARIEKKIDDPDMRVKRAAKKALDKIDAP